MMEIDGKLAREAFAAVQRYVELSRRLEAEVKKALPPGAELRWYGSTALTLADPEDRKRFGDDVLFKFPVVWKFADFYLLVMRDGSLVLKRGLRCRRKLK